MKLLTCALLPAFAIVAGISLRTSAPVGMSPPVIPSRTIEAHLAVPHNVQMIFRRACKDCHSFETRWPWYNRLPIVSGFLQRDVQRARLRMNLSDWSAKLAEGEDEAHATLNGICEGLQSDSMPLRQYRWMHRESRLTRGDVETVCRWTGTVNARPFTSLAVRDPLR